MEQQQTIFAPVKDKMEQTRQGAGVPLREKGRGGEITSEVAKEKGGRTVWGEKLRIHFEQKCGKSVRGEKDVGATGLT